MSKLKEHSLQNGLTAYYSRKTKNWHVENGSFAKRFLSLEKMIEAHPELLQIEAIKQSLERKKLAEAYARITTQMQKREKLNFRTSKTVICYYCSGTGMVANMPCPNCDGSGKIHVTSDGLDGPLNGS